METKKTIRNNATNEEYEGLPWLDSPCLVKSECSKAKSNPMKLRKVRRGNFKSMKIKSTPLMLKSKIGTVKRYDISQFYKLDHKLGIGTYGEVWLATNKQTDQKVAIKIAKGSTSIKLLKNETTILKQFSCEFFPRFIDLKEDEMYKRAYLVMEYLDGHTLDQILSNSDTLSTPKSAEIISSLAKAVKVLHDKGICHRDIKPQNIIITKTGAMKLIDFNISKSYIKEDKVYSSKFYSKFFTQISSPLFAAPEIKSLDWYNESIDIWGIGVAYFCMRLGLEKFQNFDTKSWYDIYIQESELNDWEKFIISSCLSTDPETRPSIYELVEKLA